MKIHKNSSSTDPSYGSIDNGWVIGLRGGASLKFNEVQWQSPDPESTMCD